MPRQYGKSGWCNCILLHVNLLHRDAPAGYESLGQVLSFHAISPRPRDRSRLVSAYEMPLFTIEHFVFESRKWQFDSFARLWSFTRYLRAIRLMVAWENQTLPSLLTRSGARRNR